MPDDLRPGVLVEVGTAVAVTVDPPVAPGRVEGPEVSGGDPSSGLTGVSAACPFVKLLPQMVVQCLVGLLGRPWPVVVRLASDDRVQRPDHLGRGGAAQGAQLLGVSPLDLLECVAAGFGEHFGAAADVVAADGEGQEVEPGINPPDSGLFLVQGKTSLLQPGVQPVPDRLGL